MSFRLIHLKGIKGPLSKKTNGILELSTVLLMAFACSRYLET